MRIKRIESSINEMKKNLEKGKYIKFIKKIVSLRLILTVFNDTKQFYLLSN